MSITAEKVAEVLALPQEDRACLAHQLIASLDDTMDAGAEMQWNEVIERRAREIEEGKVSCRPVEEIVRDIRMIDESIGLATLFPHGEESEEVR